MNQDRLLAQALFPKTPDMLPHSADESVFRKKLLRHFGLLSLAGTILFILMLLAASWLDQQARQETLQARERGRIAVASTHIQEDLQAVHSDLRIVASLPALQYFLDHPAPAQRETFARLLRVWAQETRRYDALRHIDQQGHETVRIEQNTGQTLIAPEAENDSPAFLALLKTVHEHPEEEIHVEPLEFRLPQTPSDPPLSPRLHFSIQVFDSQHNASGLLRFSYLADRLLGNFRKVMDGKEHQALLLDENGNSLVTTNPGLPEIHFPKDDPQAWAEISKQESGQVSTPHGLFLFDTLPAFDLRHHAPASDATHRWKVVSHIPPEIVNRDAIHHRPVVWLVLTLVYILLLISTWFVIRAQLSRQHALAMLESAQAQQRQLIRNLPVGVYSFRFHPDGSTSFEYASPVFCEILDIDLHQLLQDPKVAFNHAHPDDYPGLMARHQQASQTLEPFRWEGRFLVRGETRWLRISSDAVPDVGAGSLWSGIISDITERKQVLLELQRSAEEIEDLYDRAPCGYLSIDGHGLVVRINATLLDWLGHTRDDVMGRMLFTEILTPSSSQLFQDNFPQFKAHGQAHNLEWELRRKDGSLLPVLVNASAIYDEYGHFVMSRSTLFDLTERKALEKELERQAHIDVLTNLSNRRHFFELAEHELSRARRHNLPLSALMLDIDHFKRCNDTWGHATGDRVLQKLAEVCLHTLREIDIPGRLGGEEFAVLLVETQAEQAMEAAERLRMALADAHLPLENGQTLSFTVSVGVAHLKPEDLNIADLLRRADTALYAAKNSGRNRVCVANAQTNDPATTP